jgi:two-component system sensor histidine kinase RegB
VVTRFGVEAWLADAVAQLPAPARVTMSSCAAQLNGPRQALTQALRNLVRNALEAAPPPGVVQVVARREGGLLLVEVVDSGKGCEPALLARVGEPFFTTKEPGQGMGLGVFLARTLAEQLGGSLAFESTLGRGTTARFALPLH